MTYALWIVQVLLALLFLFAGATKLVLPIEELTAQMPMPELLLRFIGVVEVLGGLGLVLPGLLRIRPGLTAIVPGTPWVVHAMEGLGCDDPRTHLLRPT